MTDQKRNQSPEHRAQQQGTLSASQRRDDSTETQQSSSGHANSTESYGDHDYTGHRLSSPDRSRFSREQPSIASDGGAVHRDRRSFAGDREADELGSEIDDQSSVEDSDDMYGFGGRSNR